MVGEMKLKGINQKDVVRFGKTLTSYYAFNGWAPLPINVNFYITYNCNLRCKMCWWWGKSGIKPTSQELSTQEIKNLIKQIKVFSSYISISGGEPLTRKSLIEVLSYTKDSGLKCEILTNGTLVTPELSLALVSVSDSIIISIDGPSEIHDSIRGKGNFNKAIQGVKLIKKAAEASSKELYLRLNLTISSINTTYLDDVVNIAHELDCALSFQHLIFSDHNTAHKQTLFLKNNLDTEDHTTEGFVTDLHKIDSMVIVDKLRLSQEKAKLLKVPFHISPFLKGEKGIRRWYTTAEYMPGMHCSYPWTTLYINPHGDVQPCEFINYSLGNVREQSVSDIWNGVRARKFRKILKKGLFPGCLRCCKLTNNLLF